ncbi:hypothetical protein J6590_097111 [Homalodisca vitripennis]|nr:hypothetical protein J6590_097111 [Homalodisca vitripennis]
MAYLRRAYDISMSKKSVLGARKTSPWWTDEIAGLQSRCLHRHRILTSMRRRAGSYCESRDLCHPTPMKETERIEHIIDTLFPTYPIGDLEVHGARIFRSCHCLEKN